MDFILETPGLWVSPSLLAFYLRLLGVPTLNTSGPFIKCAVSNRIHKKHENCFNDRLLC